MLTKRLALGMACAGMLDGRRDWEHRIELCYVCGLLRLSFHEIHQNGLVCALLDGEGEVVNYVWEHLGLHQNFPDYICP